MYQRIVVGTDGSKRALDAVRRAAELAAAIDVGTIHVVTVCESYSWIELEQIRHELPEEFRDLVNPEAEAELRFNEAEVITREYGVAIERHHSTGAPAEEILGVAERESADLVVVGARGLGAIERFVRGSVSTQVARHSPCDVLIVEHDD